METRKLSWRELSPSPLNEVLRGRMGDDAAIKELSHSIRQSGVLQNLIVTPSPGEGTPYQILIGERRWRAARLLGDEAPPLPCEVRVGLDRAGQLLLMGVENLQRKNLSPIQEGRYFEALAEAGLSEAEIVRKTGKVLRFVQSRRALLQLAEPVQQAILSGALSLDAAGALRDLPPELQSEVVSKLAGRKGKDIKLAVGLIKRNLNGNGHKPRPDRVEKAGQKPPDLATQVAMLQRLVALLVAELVFDGQLLEGCARRLKPRNRMARGTVKAARERADRIQVMVRGWLHQEGAEK